MRRRLFTLLSAISLLLCPCVAALWAFSYFREGWLDWVNPASTIVIDAAADDGQMEAILWTAKRDGWSDHVPGLKMDSKSSHRTNLISMPTVLGLTGSHGFRWHDYGYAHVPNSISGKDYYVIRAPIWFLMLPCLMLPGTWLLIRRRSRNRRTAGLCRHCGYDLRATPGRCPKCGRESPRMDTDKHR